MTTERSIPYLSTLKRDFQKTFLEQPWALSIEAGRLMRSWFLLIRWAFKCLWLTIRFIWRLAALIVWLLIPIPQKVDRRFEKRPTGLPIPAMDLSIVMFGIIVMAHYLW